MFGVPIMFTVAFLLLLVVGNVFLERAFKKRPALRPRFYLAVKVLGYSYLATVILGLLIRPARPALFFPPVFLIALFVAWRKSKVGSWS
jgi:hypothetical protein